jgi:hypothetical protein
MMASSPNRSRKPVDRLFGVGGAPVEQVGEIGPVGGIERGNADAEQAEHGAVDFPPQQIAPGGENAGGKLRRPRERLCPRPDAEVGGFQLQRHGAAGKRIALEAGGDFFTEVPQPQFQPSEVGDVLIKCGFRRNALGLALGVDFAIVEPARKAR